MKVERFNMSWGLGWNQSRSHAYQKVRMFWQWDSRLEDFVLREMGCGFLFICKIHRSEV